MLVLTGCGNLKDSDLSNNATTTSKKKSYQTTGTTDSQYSVLLRNGQYKTGKTAGMAATTNGNDVDTKNFESELVELSTKQFSPNKYVFQEGQILTTGTVSNWLGRYDKKTNKEGLNPVDNKKKDAGKRNPYYLEQILEQDYLTGSNNSYALGGMSIGLGLNSVDYFTKVKDGAQYKDEISRAKQTSEGKKMAEKIVTRLRKEKATKSIPLLIGLFDKTKQDSLVGGTYFLYGVVNKDSNKVDKWVTVNNKTQVLPTIGDEKAINSNDAEGFTNFKAAIQGYFPNISGVIGRLTYQDNQLTAMDISITTQFYGYSQINSFAKLVLSNAKKFLPTNAKIEIKIESVSDTQALISKNKPDDEYYVHIFN